VTPICGNSSSGIDLLIGPVIVKIRMASFEHEERKNDDMSDRFRCKNTPNFFTIRFHLRFVLPTLPVRLTFKVRGRFGCVMSVCPPKKSLC